MPKNQVDLLSRIDRWTFLWVLIFLVSHTFSTALMEIASVAALSGWIILKLQRRTVFPFERKTFIALSAFVFLSVISFFWSESPKQSFRGIFKVLQQFFLFWVVAESLNTPFRLKRTFQALAWLILILGVDGIWQYAFGKDLIRGIPYEPASAGPRISASFHNYGLLASFLITFVPVLMGGMNRKSGAKSGILNVLGGWLGLLLLFWTRLRGAWVAFLGGLVFFLWNFKKRIYLMALALAAIAGFFLLPHSMVIHLDAEGKEQSLIERVYLWERAAQVIRAKPLTGTGINTYAVAHQKYDQRQNWRVPNYYAHNGYLQIAAETGLPSLISFIGFLFLYFRHAFAVFGKLPEGTEKRILLGMLTGMVNFLTLVLIDTTFHNPQAIFGFWFLAAWCSAYQRSVFPLGSKMEDRQRPRF